MAYLLGTVSSYQEEVVDIRHYSLAAAVMLSLSGVFSVGNALAQGKTEIPNSLEGVRLFQKIERGSNANPGFQIMSIRPAGRDVDLELRIEIKPNKQNPALPYAEFPGVGGRRYTSHTLIAIPYLPNATEENFKLSDLDTAPLEVLSVHWGGKRSNEYAAADWARETCRALHSSLGVAPARFDDEPKSVRCRFEGQGRALLVGSTWDGNVDVGLTEYPSTAYLRKEALAKLVRNARAKAILSPGG